MNHYQMREIEAMQRDPSGFADYMATYGEHFSKKMCEWAVGMMKTKGGKRIEPMSKEAVEGLLKQYGVQLENDKGYDKVYVANMALADFMDSSIVDQAHHALYIKDLLDDPDGYEGLVFNRFMMDCIGKNVPIVWEDML